MFVTVLMLSITSYTDVAQAQLECVLIRVPHVRSCSSLHHFRPQCQGPVVLLAATRWRQSLKIQQSSFSTWTQVSWGSKEMFYRSVSQIITDQSFTYIDFFLNFLYAVFPCWSFFILSWILNWFVTRHSYCIFTCYA